LDQRFSSLTAHEALLGGRTIMCQNNTDAAAVTLAGAILDEIAPAPRQREMIVSLAAVLRRYQCERASTTLLRRYGLS
jgi:hypothetical protein